MPYRNKTYVAFDGDNDISYYLIMQAWRANDNVAFDFYDAHDLNSARDSSSEESIKSQLRIRMQNTKLFLLLVGNNTYRCTKFVKWEIESAIRRGLPIVVVNLNNKKQFDDDLCPSLLDDQLAIHMPFKQKIIRYAIDNWPESHSKHVEKEESGRYHYVASVYEGLGL
jgi:hypothetical protein